MTLPGLIVEGLFILHDPKIRDLLDLKIFVQVSSTTCYMLVVLKASNSVTVISCSQGAFYATRSSEVSVYLFTATRILLTLGEQRDVNGIVQQYLTYVKPSFDNHIQPGEFCDYFESAS